MESSGIERLHWDDAPVFLAIARQGTLSATAKELGIGVATVSRRIERLEKALGATLFLRHQSGYRLTREGEDLLPRAEQLEQAMLGFRQQRDPSNAISGHVRLATAENLANIIIIPALASLLAKYPGLTIDVVTDISTVNLHGQEADLAVRMTRPTRGNLKIRRIGALEYGLYGSKSYMSSRVETNVPSDLGQDRFIGWAENLAHLPAAHWLDAQLQGCAPILRTTTLAAQMQAAIAGIGLAVLPDFMARNTGLERLPVSMDFNQAIWLAVHADLSRSHRIRVVAEHVVAALQDPANGLVDAQ